MSLKAGLQDIFFDGREFLPNFVSEFRDSKFNETTELALLHGIYTGIISVALWNISFAAARGIIHYDDLFDEGYNIVLSHKTDEKFEIGISITAVMSTLIADSIMIWRCWMVWGRRWPTVLLPILCLISGFVCQILDMITLNLDASLQITLEFDVSLLVIYISCILATTLWCTTLIVIRILTVTRGANDRLRDYRHIIEVLVESSALHSVTLIIYIALEASHNTASDYVNTLAAITNGVAPTLLAGRVAAGHARPDDSWEGSIMSSLRFESRPQADAETFSRVDSMVDNDLEAQPNQVDEPEEIGAEKRI